jgi:hypothetical protein
MSPKLRNILRTSCNKWVLQEKKIRALPYNYRNAPVVVRNTVLMFRHGPTVTVASDSLFPATVRQKNSHRGTLHY